MTLEGNPWFHKDDVARALGLSFEAMKHHVRNNLDPQEKRVEKLPSIQGKGSLFLSESGLYKITLRVQRSNPLAAAFQDWVTKEVLPSIRKTGSFVTGQPSLQVIASFRNSPQRSPVQGRIA